MIQLFYKEWILANLTVNQITSFRLISWQVNGLTWINSFKKLKKKKTHTDNQKTKDWVLNELKAHGQHWSRILCWNILIQLITKLKSIDPSLSASLGGCTLDVPWIDRWKSKETMRDCVKIFKFVSIGQIAIINFNKSCNKSTFPT